MHTKLSINCSTRCPISLAHIMRLFGEMLGMDKSLHLWWDVTSRWWIAWEQGTRLHLRFSQITSLVLVVGGCSSWPRSGQVLLVLVITSWTQSHHIQPKPAAGVRVRLNNEICQCVCLHSQHHLRVRSYNSHQKPHSLFPLTRICWQGTGSK